MCGIFSLLNNIQHYNYNYGIHFNTDFINKQFLKGKNRGPEFSKLEIQNNIILGFHRLAINGLNDESNQPIVIDGISLICNGEIYNYKELYNLMNVTSETNSDCEVIIHLYKLYGIEQTLQMLDGVFSFVLYDNKNMIEEPFIYIARDPYGVRPLYKLIPNCPDEDIYGFSSELKVLNEFCLNGKYTVNHFKPGTYSSFTLPLIVSAKWTLKDNNKPYHNNGFNSIMYYDNNLSKIIENIQYYFTNAIKKRTLVTERPIACLLSGGLDSSLVTALVNEIHKENSTQPLETYSIGLKGSEDLKYARIVADYLGTKHTEVILNEKDFFDAIPEVIEKIESYDTTTVRASIGNYLVSKYISQNSDAKVIFNGDGSDELTGGYLYMHKVPDCIEFDKETRRLLDDIHMFDVLRSDKCISSNGLEPRTPFLDRSFVQYYLSIPSYIRSHANTKKCEKFLLRTAFSKEHFLNSLGKPLLPDNIIWRKKEAFSDGVIDSTRTLGSIIEDYIKIESIIENGCYIPFFTDKNNKNIHNNPNTREKLYYRNTFNNLYPNMGHLVPYFWMPKYVEATDASARTLTIYSNENILIDETENCII
jgi:asparagine synthase (glutamine-hydrolysing)